MSAEFDVYIATSGPYHVAFVAEQIDSIGPCPAFDAFEEERPGVLGVHEGVPVVHPAWLWGDTEVGQPPQQLLVVHTGVCALAVDSCRLQRVVVAPPPAALAGSAMVFGVVNVAEGVMPVIDLARVPLI